ncbi:hypothetical protein AAFF_G00341730 [Aldrovandia affinis]|uniref:Uncharacterized protein n=1 Tax=Aldrovandia affinis TaxID=143900 RepID=A0AAD7WPN2_9TELE|nr:hypothetical protein AAFF_G00341730 [Aldrovandia affinis]
MPAPVVISNAGMFNTFEKFLPPEIRAKPGKMDNYSSLSQEDVAKNILMMFITFPSAKDPTASVRHPGKSCMTLLTMTKYEWFKERMNRRGSDYTDLQNSIARALLDWALTIFPQLRDKVAWVGLMRAGGVTGKG